jgi:hypothetical protein
MNLLNITTKSAAFFRPALRAGCGEIQGRGCHPQYSFDPLFFNGFPPELDSHLHRAGKGQASFLGLSRCTNESGDGGGSS